MVNLYSHGNIKGSLPIEIAPIPVTVEYSPDKSPAEEAEFPASYTHYAQPTEPKPSDLIIMHTRPQPLDIDDYFAKVKPVISNYDISVQPDQPQVGGSNFIGIRPPPPSQITMNAPSSSSILRYVVPVAFVVGIGLLAYYLVKKWKAKKNEPKVEFIDDEYEAPPKKSKPKKVAFESPLDNDSFVPALIKVDSNTASALKSVEKRYGAKVKLMVGE